MIGIEEVRRKEEMKAQSGAGTPGAKLAPIVLGLCGLTIWTPWAAAELVDNLPINYSLEAGDCRRR